MLRPHSAAPTTTAAPTCVRSSSPACRSYPSTAASPASRHTPLPNAQTAASADRFPFHSYPKARGGWTTHQTPRPHVPRPPAHTRFSSGCDCHSCVAPPASPVQTQTPSAVPPPALPTKILRGYSPAVPALTEQKSPRYPPLTLRYPISLDAPQQKCGSGLRKTQSPPDSKPAGPRLQTTGEDSTIAAPRIPSTTSVAAGSITLLSRN